MISPRIHIRIIIALILFHFFITGIYSHKYNFADTFPATVNLPALSIPDIDSDLGFIHTLFAVEDLHGARVEKNENEVHIVFDGNKPNVNHSVFQMLTAWAEQSEKYRI